MSEDKTIHVRFTSSEETLRIVNGVQIMPPKRLGDEKELLDLESSLQKQAIEDGPAEEPRVSAALAFYLVANLRRLRGLIAGDELRWKYLLAAIAETPHRPPLTLHDFVARLRTEAEAIRKGAGMTPDDMRQYQAETLRAYRKAYRSAKAAGTMVTTIPGCDCGCDCCGSYEVEHYDPAGDALALVIPALRDFAMGRRLFPEVVKLCLPIEKLITTAEHGHGRLDRTSDELLEDMQGALAGCIKAIGGDLPTTFESGS